MSLSSQDCIFCKIIAGQIPANIVHEGPQFVAIRDINPQAPTHILVLPRQHIANVKEVADRTLTGELLAQACLLAEQEKLEHGFRLVINTGEQGGQTVDHLHIHLLGGRAMSWPPG